MSLQHHVIYQLLDSRSFGGIETHIFQLSDWLKNQGFHNEVIFLKNYGPHPLQKKLTAHGIRWQALESLDELNTILKTTRCMVATHGYKAGIIGRFLGKLNGRPVVSTFHSGDCGSGKLRWYTRLDDLSSRLAKYRISVSKEIAARLPVSSTVIPNFIKPQKKVTNLGTKIAFVGRLSHEKGPDLFAQITADDFRDYPVCMYGEGPMYEELHQSYPHLRMMGQVEMETHWEDIAVLCITSRFEGLPLVALEAMSRGIPVISFAMGALPELITHNKNGWLIPAGDIKGFKAAVNHALSLSDQAFEAVSSAAYELAHQKYSCDVVLPNIISLYEQACAKTSAHLTSEQCGSQL